MKRDFTLFNQAGLLYEFAVQVQAMVIGWQIYEIKKAAFYLGLVGLIEAVPALVLALMAGYIVDLVNPLMVYKNVLRLTAVSAAILYFVSGSGWGMSLDSKVLWIYAAAFIAGIGKGFAGPARDALVPQLVSRHELSVSSAWTTSAIHVATVAGPALGGMLYAWLGAQSPHGADCVLLAAGLALLALVRYEFTKTEPPAAEPLMRSITSGLKFVFKHQLLLSALSLDMFAVLFGGMTALLPIFAKDILGVGPIGLGILRAAPAVGALIASAFLIRYPINRRAGKILLWVVAGFGVTVLGFAVSTVFWLSVFLLALGGAFDSVSMVIRSTMVRLYSSPSMRGRIAAVNSIFISCSNELGAFESGLAASLMGAVPSVILGGVVTLLTVGAVTVWATELHGMDLSPT